MTIDSVQLLTHSSLPMKRLLAYILLLVNLCSGVAFALDTHPEAVVGHDAAAIDLVAGEGHDHPDGDLHHGDHCCHGAAHFIGMLSDVTMQVTVASHDHFHSPAFASSTLYIAPLLRPPIV